jgi:hypothetical protein
MSPAELYAKVLVRLLTVIDRSRVTKVSLKPESELMHGGTGGDTVLIKPAALAVPLRYRYELVVRPALVM